MRRRHPSYIILLICHLTATLVAVDYELVGENPAFLVDCDDSDSNGAVDLLKVVDLSHLQITNAGDSETFLANGYVLILEDIPPGKIKFEGKLYEWKNGKWVPTIFSLRKTDFCAAIFDPKEFWHPLMSRIPPEYRDCPPKKGARFYLHNSSNKIVIPNMGPSRLSGRYKGIYRLSAGKHRMCLASVFELNQI